jgi:hypothetical protein
MTITRQRVNRPKTFEERLAEEAARFKEAAAKLPQGLARELLLRRARQAETASHMSEWLRSPGCKRRDQRLTAPHGNTQTVISAIGRADLPILNIEMAWSRSALVAAEQAIQHIFGCLRCAGISETKTLVKVRE